jgi:hypothetical protein
MGGFFPNFNSEVGVAEGMLIFEDVAAVSSSFARDSILFLFFNNEGWLEMPNITCLIVLQSWWTSRCLT